MRVSRSFGLFAVIFCLIFVWAGLACAQGRGRDDFKKAAPKEEEKAAKPETPDKTAKAEKTDKTEKAEKAEKTEKAEPPKDEPKVPGLPGIDVDVKNKKVSITAKVCLTQGILEYVLVATGGKEYESMFAADAKPSLVHASLLMVGAVAGKIPEEFMGDDKEKASKKSELKEASYFTVTLEWVNDGQKVVTPVEQLLMDREKNQAAQDLVWAFTGSLFYKMEDGKERYLADEDGSIIATYYDDGAILNLALKSKDPYRGDDFGFEVNTKKIPPKGTTVLIVFQLKEKKD